MSRKTVGIIGGMGPEATVDFMAKIIKKTPAQIDQNHLHLLVDNNPQIPDRLNAILNNGQNPGPVLAQAALNLAKWGAEILAMPCNTAHYYYPEIQQAVQVPVLNIIDETIKILKRDHVKSVGLLATIGTLKTMLYHEKLKEANINVIIPDEFFQKMITRSILTLKRGDYQAARANNQQIIDHIVAKNAEAIILGCTELPIVFNNKEEYGVTLYDPTEILAEAVVREAY
ncbi:MAG: aspartate/glutamate racemase family protein [Bacillota bacterium]